MATARVVGTAAALQRRSADGVVNVPADMPRLLTAALVVRLEGVVAIQLPTDEARPDGD
jgi:hypothetical protein